MVAAVEPIVKVDVAAVVPLMVIELGDNAQVIGSFAAAGAVVTAQERAIAPVNPLTGVAVRVEVLAVAAPALTVIAPLFESVMPGAPVTVTVLVVKAVSLPVAASTPVTVTTYVPAVVLAVELAVRIVVAAEVPVRTIVAGIVQVIGLVVLAGEEVTAQLRFTTPAKPPDELAVTVAVPVEPALTAIAPALSAKAACVTETVVVPVEAA